MPPEVMDKLIVLCLYVGMSSLAAVLAFAGVCVYVWSHGEHVDGNCVGGMFRSVVRAIKGNKADNV